MLKKLNNFITSSIFISILFIFLGIVMIIFPSASLRIFSLILALVLIINGIYLIVLDINIRSMFMVLDTFPSGTISSLLGVLMLIYPSTLSIIIPITLGSWFILNSIFKMRIAFYLKDIEDVPWLVTLIMAILSIVCGIILILNPIKSSITITLFLGIMIIIYSISDIADMIILKKYIRRLVKHLKRNIKIIDE